MSGNHVDTPALETWRFPIIVFNKCLILNKYIYLGRFAKSNKQIDNLDDLGLSYVYLLN